MYVSYLLEKDGPMYPGPVRHSGGLNLAAQNFVGAPQYADYGGYHVNLDGAQSPGSAWPAPYAAPLRDDWGTYGQGAPPTAGPVHGLNGGSPAPPWHTAPAAASAAPERCPGGQRRGLCEWMRKPAQPPLSSQGKFKTRTKDKYRVVYTDHQRLELEKEFHYSRYITIRRKAELASNLGLSERQVKIWFQNRRAKERKINKKKLQQAQPGGAEPSAPAPHCRVPRRGRPPPGWLCAISEPTLHRLWPISTSWLDRGDQGRDAK
uniref:Homeobox domain-containing protein n=1 Tax=Malurus cyaneus samueli TaxID=2593467 RepID=A0A8C5TEF0_9PASS